MSAAGDKEELRRGDEIVHIVAFRDWSNLVEVVPDNEDGHFEGGEFGVGDIVSGEHGGEGALNDPGVFAGVVQDVAGDECGDLGRIGHEESVELFEFGFVLRSEEAGVPAGL